MLTHLRYVEEDNGHAVVPFEVSWDDMLLDLSASTLSQNAIASFVSPDIFVGTLPVSSP